MPRPVLSAEARRDLKGIQNYIVNEHESPQAVFKVTETILERIEDLIGFPDTGTLLSPKVNFPTNYRYARAAGYLIFHRHESDVIFIDRIIYGKRDYLSILFP